MKRLLLLGAGGSAGINFIKSLRNAPEEFFIVGTDTNKYHLELPDLDKRYLIPHASNEEYINKVNEVILKEDIEFVHAQPDIEVYTISKNRNEIKAKIFLPSHKTIELCQNKYNTSKVLEMEGIPVAKCYKANEVNLDKAFNELKDKNNRVWIRAIRGAGSRASLPAFSADHIKFWINYWKLKEGMNEEDFMISEFLPGDEYAFQSLWKNGRLITSQARKRVEYLFGNITPSGQTSTPSVAVTVNDEEINKIATKAIKAVDTNPNGIYCVDIKKNKDGIPCVTEINAGRFFTTNDFYSNLGCNMPWLYVKLAFNEKIPPVKQYNPVPEGYYWIRLPDAGPILIKEGEFRSIDLRKKSLFNIY
jgi:glutathione synthase/RimK-type ligase-like ATP-grasp enzyme